MRKLDNGRAARNAGAHLARRRITRGTVTLAGLLLGAFIGLVLAPLLPPIRQAQAATTPVGTTEGKFEVTQRGSAQYKIPIYVPPGTRGIAPQLSLVYDSQAGNGMLGHGWSLGGLSIIHRCAATIELDGFSSSVSHRFCLDGERLIHIGGGEYHTRHETWQRVLAYNASGQLDTSSNPAYFLVLGKDGVMLEYGKTADARIQSRGTIARVWALNKMTDRVGNYYTITYTQDTTNGDYRPARVDYTANDSQSLAAYNSVIFTYAARTDTPPRYEAGFALRSMQRLTNIKTYAGPELAREYRLGYDNNGAAGRSRLTSVQECGSDGVCLPATQFTWQNGAVGFGTAQDISWSANKTADAPIGFADINGDGRQDFWGWSGDGYIKVRLANGDGTFQNAVSTYWSTNKSGDGPVGFADINGDGKADFWGWWNDGNIRVRLSNGDGTFAATTSFNFSSSKANPRVGFADFGGDGLADFWGWSNDGNVCVRFSNGDGTFSNPPTATYFGTDKSWGASVTFADVNGDGRADLVGDRNSGTFSGNCPYNGQPYTGVYRQAVVSIAYGDGTFGPEGVIVPYTWGVYFDPITQQPTCADANLGLGDVNGDGYVDVGGVLSTGDGTFVGGGFGLVVGPFSLM
jgi:hypothetical protein